MNSMHHKGFFLLVAAGLLCLAGCGSTSSVCPLKTGTPLYLSLPPEELPTPTPISNPVRIPMEIGGRSVLVDRVITGPLCNDSWSGTIYVTCDVQVYQWEDQPTFLKDCNLSIAPETVVYVAYHQDTAYYKGCGCHTGEITGP